MVRGRPLKRGSSQPWVSLMRLMCFIGAKMAYLVSIMRLGSITILLLVIGRVSAQNDTIFPNSSDGPGGITANWSWYDNYVDGIGGPWSLSISAFYMAQPAFEQDGMSWGTVYREGFIPQGRIAVDSGRVYFRPIVADAFGIFFPDTLTRLMYDFNMQVGDTAYMSWSGFPQVIESIDTVYLGGRPRSRFNLSDDEQWIAGMGSTRGLMYQFMLDCECGSSNLYDFCGNYMDADSVAYQACLPFSTVGIPVVPMAKLAIHPNPCAGTFIIAGTSPNRPFQLTDARGIEILSGRTTGESTTLRIPNAVPGLYVLDVNGTRTKVIVQ